MVDLFIYLFSMQLILAVSAHQTSFFLQTFFLSFCPAPPPPSHHSEYQAAGGSLAWRGVAAAELMSLMVNCWTLPRGVGRAAGAVLQWPSVRLYSFYSPPVLEVRVEESRELHEAHWWRHLEGGCRSVEC